MSEKSTSSCLTTGLTFLGLTGLEIATHWGEDIARYVWAIGQASSHCQKEFVKCIPKLPKIVETYHLWKPNVNLPEDPVKAFLSLGQYVHSIPKLLDRIVHIVEPIAVGFAVGAIGTILLLGTVSVINNVVKKRKYTMRSGGGIGPWPTTRSSGVSERYRANQHKRRS